MKRFGISIFAMAAIQSFCLGDVTRLPASAEKVLHDSSRFHEVHPIAKLPPAVAALCADHNGRLADPGQKWQAACVIMDASLPRKRLIWAVSSEEYYVVHYEVGGRGHSFHVMVATLAKGELKPKLVWHAVGPHLKDYAAFLAALRNGTLDDRYEYSH